MRRFPLLAIWLTVTSCSPTTHQFEHPDRDHLPVGQSVFVTGLAGGSTVAIDLGSDRTVYVQAGLVATVDSDPDVYQETALDVRIRSKMPSVTPAEAGAILKAGPQRHGPGEPEYNMRHVTILIRAGDHRGRLGTVRRYNLRPAPPI